MLWVEKYKPKTLKEVEGQDEAVSKLKAFVQGYKKGAALVYGKTGTGKTCAVYAMANDLDLEILELNASDVRNKDKLNSVVGESSKQMSLFNRKKLIFLDEVDALSGPGDRGCVQALAKVLSESRFPIVLTAEDPYEQKISPLRRSCKLVEFPVLSHHSVFNILKKVCEGESIRYDENILNDLARRSGGDARAAVNDLQIICATKKVLDSLEDLGEREKKESIINALKLIFKSRSPENVLNAFDKTDLNLDECLLWLDENLPREYHGQDLISSYNYVSKADVFKGRITRWQYWRFLVYVNDLLTAGVAVSKKNKSDDLVSYKPTSRILKIWKAKMRNAKKKSIAEKIARNTHTSTRRVLRDTLPYLEFIFKKRKGGDIIEELGLDEEEVEWLSS
ncbi:MAG: replication factor C large subunit [Nanoarchaeota archaeon]|nr:replication factor C large subunit [Nanoarchaeota archaeon]